MSKLLCAALLLALYGCQAVPGVRVESVCPGKEASYECQVERYMKVGF